MMHKQNIFDLITWNEYRIFTYIAYALTVLVLALLLASALNFL